MNNINQKRAKRQRKVRSKISGTKACPRLSVYRSNKYIYGQIINDEEEAVLVSVNEKEILDRKKKTTKVVEKKSSKIERAGLVGELLAKKALKKKIKKVVFDRGCYKYHGRVKALADGARKGGLKF